MGDTVGSEYGASHVPVWRAEWCAGVGVDWVNARRLCDAIQIYLFDAVSATYKAALVCYVDQ